MKPKASMRIFMLDFASFRRRMGIGRKPQPPPGEKPHSGAGIRFGRLPASCLPAYSPKRYCYPSFIALGASGYHRMNQYPMVPTLGRRPLLRNKTLCNINGGYPTCSSECSSVLDHPLIKRDWLPAENAFDLISDSGKTPIANCTPQRNVCFGLLD